MKDTLKSRNKEIEDLKAKILAAKKENDSLDDQIKMAVDVLNDTIKANDDLSNKIIKAEGELRDELADKRKLEYDVQELKHERDIKNADLTDSNNRLKNLHEDLKENVAHEKDADNTLKTKKQDLANKEKKLQDLHTVIEKLRKLIDDKDREAIGLEDKIYDEEQAIRKLSSDPSRQVLVLNVS